MPSDTTVYTNVHVHVDLHVHLCVNKSSCAPRVCVLSNVHSLFTLQCAILLRSCHYDVTPGGRFSTVRRKVDEKAAGK